MDYIVIDIIVFIIDVASSFTVRSKCMATSLSA